ncbi:RNA polymerase sigma factor [Sphingobacterium deserti]|uniref:RNA polymerase sigma-70 factor n=1 Tax=Sphingobacterium deserti TaxID=1229276 RepID=A0A0B8SZE3_9SPHI|nr:RNA polymerase sigma-70 factor [Sphingobacterium deserti]KGE13122.1 RNA polymerase sigma-70 factor [Sphingobacterium deserti]
MERSSDKILWENIALGDYKAFDSMYDSYGATLLSIASKKLGDTDAAMDVVQELFIDIWQRRHAINIQTSIKSYLISALHFKVFMYFRRQGVQQKHIDNYKLYVEPYSDDELFSAKLYEEQFENLQEAIEESVREMPLRMKEVFQLKYYKALNNKEIADSLGLSTQTVKNQLSKALQQIRRHMEEQQVDVIYFALIGLMCI